MARTAVWRRWAEPPQVPVEIDWSHPLAKGLVWYSAPSSHPLGTGPGYYLNGAHQILNIANPKQAATAADGNNIYLRGPTPAGLGLKGAWLSSPGAMAYNISSTMLSGLTQFSLSSWFYKRPVTTSEYAELKTFRFDFQHCLDVYTSTPTQLRWGSDWNNNWNGSNQQTLDIAQGFVIIGSSIASGVGARYHHQGRFSGTKSGGSFTTSSSVFAVVRHITDHEFIGNAAWRRALEDAEMVEFQRNPYALLKPYSRRLYLIPGGGGPATRTVVATGGITFAGLSALARVRALQTQGGVVFAGAATVSTVGVRTHVVTPSGGYVFAGAAAARRARAVLATGGLVFSGAATVSSRSTRRTVVASGGLTLGGSAYVQFPGVLVAQLARRMIYGRMGLGDRRRSR